MVAMLTRLRTVSASCAGISLTLDLVGHLVPPRRLAMDVRRQSASHGAARRPSGTSRAAADRRPRQYGRAASTTATLAAMIDHLHADAPQARRSCRAESCFQWLGKQCTSGLPRISAMSTSQSGAPLTGPMNAIQNGMPSTNQASSQAARPAAKSQQP